MTDEHEVGLAQLLDEVRRIEVQSSRLVTAVMAGNYHSVFRGAGLEFDEVREYVEGDDPRAVDWNVTARLGRPYVKTYVDERELTVMFVLDLSASMGGGWGVWSARQTAARVCACLALSAVKNNDRVGLIAFSDGVDKYVPPRKGSAHMLRIVRDCLALPASRPGTDARTALELVSRVVRRHAVVFVISDFLSGGWGGALSVAARRHDVVAVRLLSPELAPPELPAPGGGLVRVRDPEDGSERLVDWSSPCVRDAYAERVQAWRERTERVLRRAGVDRMDVAIPRRRERHVIGRPITRFFRMRERRRSAHR